ncbi:hypothetical protein H5410_011768 [Solanum commersonii]|uniref:Uncharacterized protein n=1 Tax=Solanum commersonii TaxID=4109 RepID=A0A9J6APN5_SOLCO|nr:hypothetical protein H5410_011768 [Solanum commersonii]
MLVHRRQRGIFWPSGKPERMESIRGPWWFAGVVNGTEKGRKTVERGTRLVRSKELVRQLMVFGFVEIGEG